MKLVLKHNVAEIYDGDKLVARLKTECGACINAHIEDPEAINVVKVDGVAVEVDGGGFAAIDVKQKCDT